VAGLLLLEGLTVSKTAKSNRKRKDFNINHTVMQFRLRLGLSPEQFASDIGTSPSFIRKLEDGVIDADYETLELCAHAFNMELSEMLSPE
ncbi:MAG: helix-turn-helix transcriptional regulator, partial [Cyanobacteria bacterium]|nr:helix-turn-helix transcriptional regulator [Cyanobacteriota bacterium]